ncbi:MAG TPA: hypothetical protein PLP33_24825 [Leptospiraceae bacterium]|nr:hypothetical protein [Leptospiraceae bacterium]
MIIDGLKARKSKRIGWRNSDPTRDFDLCGDPVESNYVAFVRISDCRIYEKEGRRYYDASNAPSIPVNHGGTYYGYSSLKKKSDVYYRDVYFVIDNYIYVAKIKYSREKAEIQKERENKYKISYAEKHPDSNVAAETEF